MVKGVKVSRAVWLLICLPLGELACAVGDDCGGTHLYPQKHKINFIYYNYLLYKQLYIKLYKAYLFINVLVLEAILCSAWGKASSLVLCESPGLPHATTELFFQPQHLSSLGWSDNISNMG